MKAELRIAEGKGDGFTLVELMIAMAVIGILSAIALPSYNEYMRRAARAGGQNYLADVAQRQELFFQNNRTYATTTGNLNAGMPGDVAQRYNPPVIVVNAGPPPSFTITMLPLATGLLGGEGVVTLTNDPTVGNQRTWVDKNSNVKRWDEK